VLRAQEVIQRITAVLPRYARPSPQYSPYDFELLDNRHQLRTIVEVKCRNNWQRAYPTLIISKRKIDACLDHAFYAGIGFVLLVNWYDQLGWTRILHKGQYPVKTGGRADRDDIFDTEAVYDIPTTAFKQWTFN